MKSRLYRKGLPENINKAIYSIKYFLFKQQQEKNSCVRSARLCSTKINGVN
jgi:hypothetical protein